MFENFFYYFNWRTIVLVLVIIYHILNANDGGSLLRDMGVGQSSSSSYSAVQPIMKQRTWNEIIKFRD